MAVVRGLSDTVSVLGFDEGVEWGQEYWNRIRVRLKHDGSCDLDLLVPYLSDDESGEAFFGGLALIQLMPTVGQACRLQSAAYNEPVVKQSGRSPNCLMRPETCLPLQRHSGDNGTMATLAETSRTKQQSRAAQDRHQQFIDHHRQVLLRYLDGRMPATAEEPHALSYVESVMTEWNERFRHDEIADPDPRERTFWYALYQLEELAELRGPQIDPYEKILMQTLVEVRELLRNRQPLPEHRFMATRPDGK